MAANRRQQQRLLAGLLLVLVAVVGYQLLGRPAASGRPPSNGVRTAAHPRAAGGAITGGVPDVGLEALKATQPEPLSAGRNLFQFGAAPAPNPGPGAGQAANAMRPPAVTDGGAANGGRPPVEPIPLKFIGIVEAPGPMGRVAVLSDGRDVYHGHEGDIIEGRYRIVRIGLESIEMAHLDGTGRQMIRLTGGS
jgi:hypothetical protein